jgi:hypothetical protein
MESNLEFLKQEELEKIKEKLKLIQRERIELVCKSIKFSTKMMTRIITILENYENSKINETDILMKIKLFLKVSRLVVENSKECITESKSDREREFFTM